MQSRRLIALIDELSELSSRRRSSDDDDEERKKMRIVKSRGSKQAARLWLSVRPRYPGCRRGDALGETRSWLGVDSKRDFCSAVVLACCLLREKSALLLMMTSVQKLDCGLRTANGCGSKAALNGPEDVDGKKMMMTMVQ